MSITRGEFLRSLGKSLPGLIASTGMATAAESLVRRLGQVTNGSPAAQSPAPQQKHDAVPFLRCGPPESRGLALTFDDGPTPKITERLLATLRDHGVSATFFLIGEKVEAQPELARRILAEGHELGHHTYTHRKLTELSDADFDRELDRTQVVFENVLGRRAAWFRPPFGALRQDQARRVRDRGMRVVLWSVDGEDWRDPSAESVTERVRTHLHPGGIVLGHEVASAVESLPGIIAHVRSATPYRFVALSALIATQG